MRPLIAVMRRRSWWVQCLRDGRSLGRRDHDLVADAPAGGVDDGDRPVARLRRPGETGPRRLGRAVAVEHAGADDPEADVGRERGRDVPAPEAASRRRRRRRSGERRGAGRTRHEAAGDDDVAARRQPPAPGRVEHERPRGPIRTPATSASTSSSTGWSIRATSSAAGHAAAPGRRIAPARVGRQAGAAARRQLTPRRAECAAPATASPPIPARAMNSRRDEPPRRRQRARRRGPSCDQRRRPDVRIDPGIPPELGP